MKSLAILLISLCAAGPAAARCFPVDDVLTALAARYHEAPIVIGVDGEATFIFAGAPDGGTFTLLRALPGGMACVIGTGEGWALAPVAPQGEEG